MMRTFVASLIFVALLGIGAPAHAATPLEVSGWLPYWKEASSTADALAHLSQLKEINPFGYTVKADGTLKDNMGITEEPWASLIAAAKAKKVRVIPTVTWGDGDAIHAVLSNTTARIALEDRITALVKSNNFDGIDIDFEGKHAETRVYFATFLKGLYQRMGTKWVMCDIEARTPLDSRYDGTPPPDAAQYANDYVAINKYCDRVKIMAYDQGSIDLKLNKARAAPYVPVADPAWVEKVMLEAAKTISKKKLMIGIPTYGYEYEVSPLSEYGYRYERLWALNPKYATDLAAQIGATPVRNSSGELSFIYKSTGITPTGDTIPVSQTNDAAAASASLYSQQALSSAIQPPFNIVWWADAQAAADKIAVAKKLGLRGVSFFKIDGGEDTGIWNVLK